MSNALYILLLVTTIYIIVKREINSKNLLRERERENMFCEIEITEGRKFIF